ncbi:MAG TPA: RIO1 family regulatory kinase/ATPase [Anaerolineales bacterium]|nr:RIO1 family regulatory kinase/ATPase [Anaerolineales bacterium]
MKITLNKVDAEDVEVQNFVKFKSNKKHKLKGKQSVTQLVSCAENPDPNSKFQNSDLNQLSKMGFLDELISGIKTGKEAAVYLGKNSDGFVAVKMYTDLRVRSFKRDGAYREGRFIGDTRIEKAIEQGSQKGLDAHQILWVQEEFRQMKHLYGHGVHVPKAIAVNGISLVMEFIGDEYGNPAPRISDLKMERDEAEEAFRQSVRNLKLIVRSGRVHGDYSTFNILWHNEKAIVIDFPQVMEFRNNPNAHAFLERDVNSLCKSFRRQGIKADEVKVLREVREHLIINPIRAG